MDQVSTKYTNILHCKTLTNLPKLGFLVWKQKPSGNPVIGACSTWRAIRERDRFRIRSLFSSKLSIYIQQPERWVPVAETTRDVTRMPMPSSNATLGTSTFLAT
jgi:hypothetical protein